MRTNCLACSGEKIIDDKPCPLCQPPKTPFNPIRIKQAQVKR